MMAFRCATTALSLGLASAAPAAHAATTYAGAVTGVQAHDAPGGSGGYSPGYAIQATADRLTYTLGDADRIALAAVAAGDVFAVKLIASAGSLPTTLDVAAGAGLLDVAAVRPVAGAWGVAIGMEVDGGSVTVNGRANVYAQSDDPVPTSAALGVRVRSGSATFQGAADIRTYTPGYSQGLWVYQGAVSFNGPATVLAQARGESTTGVYNAGGGASRIDFNQGASIAARAIYPSDNVHGVYNDNQNSRIRVVGALDITAVSQGSTAFGVRNQGLLEVAGNTVVAVTGPRSTHGIANTHRTARMNFGGDVDIAVTNTGGYVPFGNPTAVGNGYPGTSYVRFDGAVTATVAATTETYAIDNASTLQFTSATKRVSLAAASSCGTCDVYGIRNQGGSVQATGGLIVSASAASAGKAHAIRNVAAGGRGATVVVNETAGQLVQLDGDVVTGALPGETGTATTRIVLAAPGSFLHGGIAGYAGADGYYHAGDTELTIGPGATWRHDGVDRRADFGGGKLAVAGSGVVDATRLLGNVLTIDGASGQGADVALSDRAVLRMYTDVTGVAGAPAAGRIVFGGGVGQFAAPGTVRIAVVRDPLFDSGALADTDAPVLYPIAASVVVDATPAAGGVAAFAAVSGRTEAVAVTVGGAARTALVQPAVALSADRRQILLKGLRVRVLPRDTIFLGGFDD
jgi:hypothetical protein